MKLKHLRDSLLKGDLSEFIGSAKTLKTPPSEIARVLSSIHGQDVIVVFKAFPVSIQLSIFRYLDTFIQKKIITGIPNEQGANILNSLNSDDRLAFFSSLHGHQVAQYLELLDEKNKKSTHDYLGYPPQSVARLVNTKFVSLPQRMTVEEAGTYVRTNFKDVETINVAYIVDENGKLLDDIPIKRLVLSDQSKTMEEIMDGFCAKLNVEDAADDAVDVFHTHGLDTLPVTNKENVLLGIVTVDDVMKVAERRSTREMQRFGGSESLEYPYVKTPFFSLIQKRAGWLIVLFIGEMLTATAMGYFEHEIAKAVMLALFVPLIISSGGNSGSQAATLIIRALAVKELSIRDWWYVMRRELLSGITLGLILGSIGFLRISLWQNMGWYDYGPHWVLMATTIFFSLIGILIWGTLSGSMIPILLKSLKQDPAASSAPFVATLVDVTGLVIYFSIAAVILKGTLL
jgi:magnesium transporter